MDESRRGSATGVGSVTDEHPGAVGTGTWECQDPFFGFREHRDLVPGVLDDDAVYVFTCGHCHSFAEALWRLAGDVELVFAYDIDAGEVRGHVLVRLDGRYLDARGWIDGLDEFLDEPDPNGSFERGWLRIEVIAPGGWLAISGDWLEPRVEDAVPFARTLLARLDVREERERRLR
jgi:hypothetical protein